MARALLALLSFVWLIQACTPTPPTLRLLRGSLPVNQEIAALIVGASETVAGPARLVLEPQALGNEGALDALENGTADLAIIENDASYYRSTLRTVKPLYVSVLHFAVREGVRAPTVRDVLDGATVFSGEVGGPARKLLEIIRSLPGADQIDFTYVDDREADPDVIFVFAPLSPGRASVIDGYELFDMARIDDPDAGSLADAISLIAPQFRPFTIPRGIYGERTPAAVTSVAIDTLLVTHADQPRVAIFDLLELLRLTEPALAAQRPDLALNPRAEPGADRYTFPEHPGALAFRARNEPGFVERLSGLVEGLTAGLGALATVLLVTFRYLGSLRKQRIDRYYQRVLEIRSAMRPTASNEECRRYRQELQSLRDEAFSLLIGEKLRPDDSFRILQELIDSVLDELEDAAGDATGAT